MLYENAGLRGQPQKPNRLWKAALYIRLSREDEDYSKEESNSITSQREFLKEYLKQHPEIEPIDFYVDDGWSGTNFNRPDFQRMMADMTAGKIDCVIVKDLSRLGRNASETGHYIDNVFARLQIRFIAIHNYIDTAESRMNAAAHCITVGIQNVINESVAATTSVNVRGTLNVERQQGKFIGSFPAYGYLKDPEDRHRLIVDPEAACVVRQIFQWYLGGKSILGIAKELNEAGIPNPSAYKKLQGMKYRHPAGKLNDGLWPDSSVRRILSSEVYIGNMVQGKNTTISFKHRQCRPVPKEDWFIVEGTHEAIIEPQIFEKAQKLLGRNLRAAPGKRETDLFAGFVRCAECGRMMSKKTNVHAYGTYRYYRCTTAGKRKKSACTSHSIRIDKLEQAVTVTIQKMISTAVQMAELTAQIDRCPERNRKSQHLLAALEAAEKEEKHITAMELDLYPDWKSGMLRREEYIQLKNSLAGKRESIRLTIANLKKSIANYTSGMGEQNDFLAVFRKHGNIEKLTRPILLELVDEILIHSDGLVEVNFKYRDEYREAVEYIEASRNNFSPEQ